MASIEDLPISEKKDNIQKFKFRNDMAQLMKFRTWATEKEMKKIIQDYIVKKEIYDKKAEELLVYK